MKASHILELSALALVTALFGGCSGHSSNEFQGYIEGEYLYVAAPLGGALDNLAVARGDSVTNGQVVFTLDREPEASAVRQAQKNLASANASLALSEAVYQRRKELRDSPSAVISAGAEAHHRGQQNIGVCGVKSKIGDPTVADSILDRLVHAAHRIELQGESMRKKRSGRGGNDSDSEAAATAKTRNQ